MRRDKLSFIPTIERPCEESWAQMHGGSRERQCELCDKQVHNFAAMSSREIELLVREADGKLCARITQRGDGSLVTLDARPRASMAAQIVATASLAVVAAGAGAQSENEQSKKGEAVLTGNVIKPDGSGPLAGAMVILMTTEGARTLVRADGQGLFKVSVPVGVYDIQISQNLFPRVRITDAKLHEGLQSLAPVRIPETIEETVTLGEIVPISRGTFRGAVTHPWSYLKYLVRKI